MSIRNLDKLFHPGSVAVVGASAQPQKLGHRVLRNLLSGGFAGPILPVHPKNRAVCGVWTYPDIASLPIAPDLAVLATPAQSTPELVQALAQRGCRTVIVVGDPPREKTEPFVDTLSPKLLAAARPFQMRLLGPQSAGVLIPGAHLNASVISDLGPSGNLAFLSQSRALCATVLDWATPRGIGFSHVVSVGASADIDFGDVLNYLSAEPSVSAILLYLRSVRDARKFLSAARAAARSKKLLVIRSDPGALLPSERTSFCSADAVYDAAFRRAGMLRVGQIDELFDAVETLARAQRPLRGARLAILSNGTGPSLLAVDALQRLGGELAKLSPATIELLKRLVPDEPWVTNPIELTAAASSQRYAQAMEVVASDPGTDALLVLYSPLGMEDCTATAQAVIEAASRVPCNVLTSWLGLRTAGAARKLFVRAGLATYQTPDQAVGAFMHMVRYRKNQAMLLQTPPSTGASVQVDKELVGALVHGDWQAQPEPAQNEKARQLLEQYGHKFCEPSALLLPAHPPLRLAMHSDRVFGPVLELGQAHAPALAKGVALPPLNVPLARQFIDESLPGGFPTQSPALRETLTQTLLRLSQMTIDLPALRSFCLEPLWVYPQGIWAERLQLCWSEPGQAPRVCLAIRPYPQELEESLPWRPGCPLMVRPIRPEDALAHQTFFSLLTEEDRRWRFFNLVRTLSATELAQMTQIDYDREMAFIAEAMGSLQEPGQCQVAPGQILGIVRAVYDPDGNHGEFAIAIRSDCKRKGLGALLIRKMIEYSRGRGVREVSGQVLKENLPMISLAQRLGFLLEPDRDPALIQLRRRLASQEGQCVNL